MALQDAHQAIIRAHVFVQGRVQGVGYRAATWDTAILLKLKGWVRNLRDGRVEAVFEGTSEQIEEMIRWCHQGPPTARVTSVQVTYETPEHLKTFQVTQ
ncbi:MULTISPECIES: acylphosphatase [unclassified Leptolyngbya]|uniref:acylphosphatase n=1 Tax=unclassified Leptolyngbya TaxID=2650499 RepID=UPI0016858006|nr:acylphosphatase [Leptolyngbya sp. FACHB-8]MBD2155857.1 acylphosphatase [Leptolyngbya sp. FACHB-16]